ncbi:chaperone modulatory protein CbpM [Pseudomonas duriflava]|uniref:Chaperone modulatory protein CbpM n=1 Tax=Pseudomonas duriflava TaxID=459528 RepID=A0A562QNK4_9PSED|nr:chaperone modulator CbpM [Pseudomonas duriflava]TWI58338.1 chaperone modulatory protein CbpM [Pseudomonas duriflava]
MTTVILEFGLDELSRLVNTPPTRVIEIVEHGIVEPSGQGPDRWMFDLSALHTVRRAVRLQRELELDWAGIALAIDLLDEVERLRTENQRLRQRLARFMLQE